MSNIETRTYRGAPLGMNQAVPVHSVSPEYARWLIDVLNDLPGLLRVRGRVNGTQIHDVDTKIHGISASWNPSDALRYITLSSNPGGPGNNLLIWFDEDYAATGGTLTIGTGSDAFLTSDSANFDAKPMANTPGGILLGFNNGHGTSAVRKRGLTMWRGAGKSNYSTGTVTVTRGTTSVSGSGTSWTANAEAGMFLFKDVGLGNFELLGVVKSVDSNTALTLEQGALFASAANNYLLSSARGIVPRVAVGRITVASGTTTVTGTGTKFSQQGLTGSSSLWRASDMSYIGDISSVASDTQLTLSANSGISLANERYVAFNRDNTYRHLSPALGPLNAAWNGRQWYANGRQTAVGGAITDIDTAWYSETFDPEAVDTTLEGTWVKFPSASGTPTPLMAMVPTQPAMLFMKATETFGIFSTGTPAEITAPRKILSDGILSTMTAVSYQSGAIWAGKRGIYQFDGTEAKNIVEDTLGDFYTRLVNDFDPQTNRAWAMIERDHYMVYIENVTWPEPYYKGTGGALPTTPSRITITINLHTKAVSLWRNVNIRGSVYVPAYSGTAAGTRWVMDVNDGIGQHKAYISAAKDLFPSSSTSSEAASDTLVGYGDTAGPDFYIESARYDWDDPQLKKRWKQVLLAYVADQGLNVDVVTNYALPGTALTAGFPASSSFTDKKVKFQKYGQLFAFRMWSPTTAVSDIQVGPWSVGAKRLRPGRV